MKTTAELFPTLGGAFMTTHWTVLQELSWRGAENDARAGKGSRGAAVRGLLAAALSFRAASRLCRDDAKDLTQGFFAYLLAKEAYRQL